MKQVSDPKYFVKMQNAKNFEFAEILISTIRGAAIFQHLRMQIRTEAQ